MRFDRVLLTLNVRLKEAELSRYLPRSAAVIGETLAAIADEYERQNNTAYYPALEFFKTLDGVDPNIVDAAEQVAWLVSRLARESIQAKLRPIFSSVHFESVQTLAFSLPRVRPNHPDAIAMLAEHYTPDTVKVELVVTMMRRDSEADDNRAEPYARKMIFRWLSPAFESVEVTSSKAM